MKSSIHLFALVHLVGSLSIASAVGHSATEPVPRSEDWWKERHETINQRAREAGDKAQVIFIGDSITQGWEGQGKDTWEKYYQPRNAVNLGIGGDRTQHVLWRLDNGNLEGLKPKIAVVMIGTNNSNGEDNTPGEIADGVAAIVQKLREKVPQTKVLLLAIFPRGKDFNAQRGKILQVNQVINKLADDQNIFWIDFGYKFVGNDGIIPRELMPDYLHLSKKGYEIWADAIEAKLASIIADGPAKSSSGNTASLSGEWIWTMPGPDGDSVTAPLFLKTDGDKITGRFRRGDEGWLDIENGKITGNEFSWTVKRDRPDGTIMTYQMSGKLENGKIVGETKTQFNGTDVASPWTASRK